MKFSSSKLVIATLLSASSIANGFLSAPVTTPPSSSTVLFLEDWVADMIDGELVRQSHKKEYENEWMEKNRAAVLSRMETDFVPVLEMDGDGFRQQRKDRLMAEKDPAKYCADRCITTGHCDVYEDFFELSPEQVIEFCVDCVLSEEEEPCDIPDGFYDKLMP
eukprot:CAMPEP_0113638978 /NCGR_PEP_ID=MMETSP0017_2-20120614/20435_1 /TAXON_ID=2856 /ORGANISM="Cylindrotheca closterium" /LENGTH=162 /DNA_ID=CAMNT_0000550143 /DNA_START=29 /DNA_END=517 /DNA_ORIENTATION=- /assembly_acc=CAM_ASM_000147